MILKDLEDKIVAVVDDHIKEHGHLRTSDILETMMKLLYNAAYTHITTVQPDKWDRALEDVRNIPKAVDEMMSGLADIAGKPTGKPN